MQLSKSNSASSRCLGTTQKLISYIGVLLHLISTKLKAKTLQRSRMVDLRRIELLTP